MRRYVKPSDALRRMHEAAEVAQLARVDTGASRTQYIGQDAWYVLGPSGEPVNAPLALLRFDAPDAPPQPYTVALAPVRQSVSLASVRQLTGNASVSAYFPSRLPAPGATVYDGRSVVRVGWGDGRVRQEAFFNYPFNGAVFALKAQSIQLDVAPLDDQNWSGQANAPAFGASIFPGEFSNPTPLWLMLEQPFVMTTGTSRDYAVPPFAQVARIFDVASSTQTMRVDQLDSQGNTLMVDFRSVTATTQQLSAFDFPLVAGCQVLRVNNVSAVSEVVGVQFRIGIG